MAEASPPSRSLQDELCDTSNEGVKAWLLRQSPSPVPVLAKLCGVESSADAIAVADLEKSINVTVKPLDEGHVGAMGDTSRLEVWFEFPDQEPKSSPVQQFIMKGVAKDRLGPSLLHGLTREVELYTQVMATDATAGSADGIDSKLLQSLAPTVFACEVDLTTGAKRVVLEDLSEHMFESGAIIGKKHTPLNFNKDVTTILAARYPSSSAPPPTQEEMVVQAFLVAARFHKAHWNQDKLLQHSWLRNADLYQAAANETIPPRFAPTMQYLCREWNTRIKPSMAAQENGDLKDTKIGLCYTKRVADLLNVATSDDRASWDYRFSKMKSGSYTMIHGDFHPGNLMISTKDNSITLLDFEMVGVGPAPQDCAQLVMSHLPPDCFGHAAEVALKAYYEELTGGENAVNADEYTFETCLEEYIDEGLGKWLWFLIILKNIMPPPMISYFATQIDAFAAHHGRDASNWKGTLHF